MNIEMKLSLSPNILVNKSFPVTANTYGAIRNTSSYPKLKIELQDTHLQLQMQQRGTHLSKHEINISDA